MCYSIDNTTNLLEDEIYNALSKNNDNDEKVEKISQEVKKIYKKIKSTVSK